MRRMFLLATACSVLACGGGESGGNAADGDAGGGAQTAAPLGSGVLSGVVNFDGTPPRNPPIDMSTESECASAYANGPSDPVVVVTGGKLKNVFVRVTGGLPAGPYPTPGQPAVIDQTHCLYEPRILGVMVNQPLEIRNSDPLLHNIKAVPQQNRPFNISQPRAGMTTTRTFAEPEIMVPLECNVHGWMQAYVGVVEHPYFATSAEDGTFRIQGLPPGTYQIETWHESLGTRTGEVTIGPDGQGSVTLTYGPVS